MFLVNIPTVVASTQQIIGSLIYLFSFGTQEIYLFDLHSNNSNLLYLSIQISFFSKIIFSLQVNFKKWLHIEYLWSETNILTILLPSIDPSSDESYIPWTPIPSQLYWPTLGTLFITVPGYYVNMITLPSYNKNEKYVLYMHLFWMEGVSILT